jgi:Rap1a immunity proteins
MRLLSVFTLIAASCVCSPSSVGLKSAAEQPDISRSGSDFLQVCTSIDSEWKADPVRIHNDATCLGWVEGFGNGFTVHDELLSIPQRDRMICMPAKVTTIQIVRVMKKYVADNPDKAHRATRFIASVALARAFPCKAGK